MTLNIASHFKAQALNNPHQIFLAGADQTMTFDQLWSAGRRLATALKSLGVRPGDRVVVLQPNDTASVVSLVSGWILGAVVVPLPIDIGVDDLVEIMIQTRAMALMTDMDLWTEAEAALLSVRSCLLHIVRHAEQDELPWESMYRWEDLILFSESSLSLNWTQPHDAAVVFYQPDEVGRWRPIELNHLNIHYLATRLVNQMWKIAPQDRLLSYAQGNFPFSQLLPVIAAVAGASLDLLLESDPADIIATIVDHEINFAILNSSVGRYLLRNHSAAAQSLDLSFLHVTILGSEKLPLQLIEQLHNQYNFRLSTGFSMYEALPITLTEIDSSAEELRSFGRPVSGTEICIRDGFGAPVQEYQSGFVFVRGPQINSSMAHFGAPQIVREGWINSGQIGYLDNNGRLYLTRENPWRFKSPAAPGTVAAPGSGALQPGKMPLQAVYGR